MQNFWKLMGVLFEFVNSKKNIPAEIKYRISEVRDMINRVIAYGCSDAVSDTGAVHTETTPEPADDDGLYLHAFVSHTSEALKGHESASTGTHIFISFLYRELDSVSVETLPQNS